MIVRRSSSQQAVDSFTDLTTAVWRGEIDEIETLLGKYGSTTTVSNEGNSVPYIDEASGWNKMTALIFAVQLGKLDEVDILIKRGANVNLENQLANTALLIAAECGNFEIVKILLGVKKGQDAAIYSKNVYSHQNIYGQTALMLAIDSYDLEQSPQSFDIVKYIADKDLDQIHVKNKQHKNSLLIASEFGKVDIVKWLIDEKGMSADTRRDTDNNSALMYACQGGKALALSSANYTPLTGALLRN
jgi:ankyrin repeat protein